MKAIKITRDDYTADEMWELYKKEKDGRMKERFQAIALMIEGKTAPQAAKALHLARNTTWEWAVAYNENGLDGLQRKSPTGKNSRLNNEQQEMLKDDVIRGPRELGYSFSNWDGKTLSHHIKLKFGVSLGARGVQILLKKLGFTRQKPDIAYAKADPEAKIQFKLDLKKRSTR